MVKKTVNPEVVLAPGTGPKTPTRPRRGLLIAVDARVIQIIRGSGAGQPRDEAVILAELRAQALLKAAARQSKDTSS